MGRKLVQGWQNFFHYENVCSSNFPLNEVTITKYSVFSQNQTKRLTWPKRNDACDQYYQSVKNQGCVCKKREGVQKMEEKN